MEANMRRIFVSLLVVFGMIGLSVSANCAPAQRESGDANYGLVPLSFELNQGQWAPQVNYLAHANGYLLLLGATEATFALRQPPAQQHNAKAKPSDVVRMRLVGSNPAPEVSGVDKLTGKSNYFIGNDPARWRANVPNYARVRYAGVYPGTDLIYYGNQRQLEYDFVVAPGADPGVITLDFEGAEKVEVNAAGDLVLPVAGRSLELKLPSAYQMQNGARKEIAAAYVVHNAHQVGFKLGAYDPARELVIDPTVLLYSTFLGGSNYDSGHGIRVDKAGNAYIAGSTDSSSFATNGAYDSTLGGCCDAFIAKLNADGTKLVYATYVGGSDSDTATSIAVDSSGAAYITGETSSTDFPHTANAYDKTFNGPIGDAFVVELNPAGSALLFSTYFGGSDDSAFETGMGIAVTKPGIIYVAGFTTATNFPLRNQIQSDQPGEDAFVAKFQPEFTADKSLVWSTYLGGGGTDDGNAIAAVAGGGSCGTNCDKVYVTGNTSSANFKLKNAFQAANFGVDAFVSRFKGTGSLVYSTYLGGNSLDMGFGITADHTGAAYVTGVTGSPNFPVTKGAFDTTCGSNGKCNGGFSQAFVTKFVPTGTSLVYSTFLGGSDGFQHGRGIRVDSAGNAYVAGTTLATDFPVTSDGYDLTCGSDGACDSGAHSDVFLSVFNSTGSALTYSTYVGGKDDEDNFAGNVIALDDQGGIYLTGTTKSKDFPTAPVNVYDSKCGTDGSCNGGQQDAFIFKLGPRPTM